MIGSLPGGLTNYYPSVLDTVGCHLIYNVFGGTLNPNLLLVTCMKSHVRTQSLYWWSNACVTGAVVTGYSTERSESYTPDTQQTATLDMKHRRRIPTPTYASTNCYTPDMVRLLLLLSSLTSAVPSGSSTRGSHTSWKVMENDCGHGKSRKSHLIPPIDHGIF